MRSSQSRHSVLLITPDPQLQRIATWILVEAGFYAAFVESPGNAAEQRASLQPDVIVVDVRPGDAPAASVSLLRETFPRARLVGLHRQDEGSGPHIDSECHLHKPFSGDELIECIHQALAASVGAASAHHH